MSEKEILNELKEENKLFGISIRVLTVCTNKYKRCMHISFFFLA